MQPLRGRGQNYRFLQKLCSIGRPGRNSVWLPQLSSYLTDENAKEKHGTSFIPYYSLAFFEAFFIGQLWQRQSCAAGTAALPAKTLRYRFAIRPFALGTDLLSLTRMPSRAKKQKYATLGVSPAAARTPVLPEIIVLAASGVWLLC